MARLDEPAARVDTEFIALSAVTGNEVREFQHGSGKRTPNIMNTLFEWIQDKNSLQTTKATWKIRNQKEREPDALDLELIKCIKKIEGTYTN